MSSDPVRYLDFILEAVHTRIQQLDCEIQLMDRQLPDLGVALGTTRDERTRSVLLRNIKAVLHDIYIEYSSDLQRLVPTPTAPLGQILSCHLSILRQRDFQILLHELYGQQSALTTLVGQEYQKYTKDMEASADLHMKMITLVFPYEFAIEMLTSSSFFLELIRTALSYEPEGHIGSVSKIFSSISRFHKLSSLSVTYHFFTAQNPMYFSMAEHFLMPFIRRRMPPNGWDSIENFVCAQKCALIASLGPIQCGLNEEVVSQLNGLTRSEPPPDSDNEFLRPMKFVENFGHTEADCQVEMPVAGLKHVVLELRRISYSATPSTIMGLFSQVNQWLTNALQICCGQKVGADEIFQFFLFCLGIAKVPCLPALFAVVNSYIDDALRETIFDYYIQKLSSAMDFIEGLEIPQIPFVLLPCAEVPARLAGELRPMRNSATEVAGFEIFAFPTWAPESETLFPALPAYTGSSETAIFHRFEIAEGSEVLREARVKTLLTISGTMFHVTPDYVQEHQMIRVDGRDYAHPEAVMHVNVFSSMMQMVGGKVENRSTVLAALSKLFYYVSLQWKMVIASPDPIEAIPRLVADLQRALMVIEILPSSFSVTGVLNHRTLRALQEFFGRCHPSTREKFTLNQQLFLAILDRERRIMSA
jgi:hypothetical protein